MDIILYTIIFLIGIFFGSFYTLAIYRIPKRQDIKKKRSYCPNCNHALGTLDLIPVFSYLFLGAKCRYCKQKIKPRYFIIEILSGFVFVALAYLMDISVYNLSIQNVVPYIFFSLYITFIFIMSGIDKENRKIEKSVNMFAIIVSLAYIIYLWILENANIYRYVIYIVCYILILLLDTITLRKCAKNKYVNGILIIIIVMAIFTGEYVTINTIILTLLAISIYLLLQKIRMKRNKSKKTDKILSKDITIGYYLGISNIIFLLFVLTCSKFLIL